jgi:hypothetical protein
VKQVETIQIRIQNSKRETLQIGLIGCDKNRLLVLPILAFFIEKNKKKFFSWAIELTLK